MKHLRKSSNPNGREILAWAVQGCLHWRVRGLDAPEVVRTATHAYLEAEDALAAWIEDEGDIDLNAWEASADLFRSWKNWSDRSGEYHGSIKKFSQRLEDRAEAIGIRKGRDGQGRRGFYGLRVTKVDLVSRPDEPPIAAT